VGTRHGRQRCGFSCVPTYILQPGAFRLTDPIGISFKRNEMRHADAPTEPWPYLAVASWRSGGLTACGLTYLKMGQWDAAIHDCRSALRLDPKLALQSLPGLSGPERVAEASPRAGRILTALKYLSFLPEFYRPTGLPTFLLFSLSCRRHSPIAISASMFRRSSAVAGRALNALCVMKRQG
jgi:tetratricopeptide repeat protein